MHRSAPGIRRLTLLDEAWAISGSGNQLAAVRSAAAELRTHLRRQPHVRSVRTLPISRFPYPTRYALGGAAWHPAPLLEMTHRALVVQFDQANRTRTLLFNPTDVDGARRTPFFANLLNRIPRRLEPLLISPPHATLEAQLAGLDLTPADIDYVAFDHFHTQDLRTLPDRFPNALLLAPMREWEDWGSLHPMQKAWYVPGGYKLDDMSRVVLFDGDIELGDGVALIRTPGHTSGNQTLFINGPTGIWGCAENGTCADSWAPRQSRIAGVQRFAKSFDVDVLLNSNTPELAAQQYTSMELERTVVDRVRGADQFFQMFPSSELTHSWMAPGLRPTHAFGSIELGVVAASTQLRKEHARVA